MLTDYRVWRGWKILFFIMLFEYLSALKMKGMRMTMTLQYLKIPSYKDLVEISHTWMQMTMMLQYLKIPSYKDLLKNSRTCTFSLTFWMRMTMMLQYLKITNDKDLLENSRTCTFSLTFYDSSLIRH
ncbi:uncharacterized protein LOC107853686 isoform X5 [Capsicum annuum]|uniref:uncharacterized protein LOC107853686 isoform X5 n=1 Tax=Capsicum annuum TaxID=4072 RepID=UPI001FB06787|nr:uncharacterized protein LOC107853686 isoform X5 [Capsicum annuum]